ncbi:MAG: carbamoyltransferase HypF [Candidatus Micrarchaeota archaeon]
MAYEIEVTGVVQGVGFRPFIYRTANALGIRGTVQNMGQGVRISVHCSEKQLSILVDAIRKPPPPLARVDDVHIKRTSSKAPKGFRIIVSRSSSDVPEVSPDIAVCNACLSEMKDKKNRRCMHPFINCTDCGPRFSLINDSPYDRVNTSMNVFVMCQECRSEYENPSNRRFHAQPISCNDCGPRYSLVTFEGKPFSNPIEAAGKFLRSGSIVAVRGIGGFHLACDAKREKVVMRLRHSKGRETKPFALMARDLSAAKEIARISPVEEKELTSARRPILVMKTKKKLSRWIAPNLDSIGIMLPYAPIHHLLFKHSGLKLLVMTSGNVQEEPIITKNDVALLKLRGLADYALLHDREIVSNCDDSIMKISNGRPPGVMRYSRGMAPGSVPIKTKQCIAGVGGELGVNFCIAKGGRAYLSQFLGDVKSYDTFLNFKENFARTTRWLKCKPEIVASDLHPSFFTTRFAEGGEVPHVMVQHHVAHMYSVMAEHGLEESIGVMLDGFGYGSDGTAWGGELLHSNGTRLGRLENFELIGGDTGGRFPYRLLYAILRKQMDANTAERALKKLGMPVSILGRQYERRINCVISSSVGRALDAAAYLFCGCEERTYEGEPAMRLEANAAPSPTNPKPEIEEENGFRVLNISKFFVKLLKEKNKRKGARMAHDYIALGFAKMAEEACEQEDLKDVCLSGGVMYNRYIPETIEAYLKKKGIRVHRNTIVPCGDGGIALGQAYYASIH